MTASPSLSMTAAAAHDIDNLSKGQLDSQDDENTTTPELPRIVGLYLTFDTDLPIPLPQRIPGIEVTECPDAPDLTRYTSPFAWPKRRKTAFIWLASTACMVAGVSIGAYSPGIEQMMVEWHVSLIAAEAGISVLTVGFAITPMVLAPFSEINGRRPVFIATGALFVVSQACCGVTRSYAGMIVARFFAGVGGSTFSTIVGGVVGDVYHSADRNKPMALFAAGAMVGTGLGPLLFGFVSQYLHWRWIFYIQAIVDGVFMAVMCLAFKETRGSVLLARKAKALNRWYAAREKAGFYFVDLGPGTSEAVAHADVAGPQRIRWKLASDDTALSLMTMLRISLVRPFHLLATEPVVFFFSIWVSFSWAVLYLTLAAVPLVFRTVYKLDLAQANAFFTSEILGALAATVLTQNQDAWAGRLFPDWSRRYLDPAKSPEARLVFTCAESLLLPVGLFLFGWTARPDIHWVVPSIGIFLATIGIFNIYLSVFNYLSDTYHRYGSSAIAAQGFCRNMIAAVFPLVTTPMYTNLTFGVASSILGAIGLGLTLVPWDLMAWGPRIRARSPFASRLARLNAMG